MTARRALWVLLAGALAVRALYCWGLSPYDRSQPVLDVDNYTHLAQNLRATGRYEYQGQPTALREPLFPLVLAATYTLGGERFDAIWLLHCLLGVVTVWLVFILGRQLFGPFEAWLAAIFAVGYPQFLYYTAYPARETFQTFLFAAALAATLALLRAPSRRNLIASAVAWGALPLTNTVFLPAMFLAGPALWLAGKRLGHERRSWAIGLTVASLALWSLWPLRNALVFGRFVPGMQEGGQHIYVQFVVPNELQGLPEGTVYLANDPISQQASALPPLERDRFYYRAAVDWIIAHPLGFAKVMWDSFVKFWRLYPYPRNYPGGYAKVKWVSLLSDGWLVPLGFLGLFFVGWRRPDTALVNVMMGSVMFVYMVSWATIRYRLPLMPVMVVYAAYAIARLLGKPAPQETK
ncbi:MAG: glycosyltransferase family 39 protein [Elusimicrobia bacterium]|nr:glycosyltransferase family 39 protein [Elusimicrobiota bacterium]